MSEAFIDPFLPPHGVQQRSTALPYPPWTASPSTFPGAGAVIWAGRRFQPRAVQNQVNPSRTPSSSVEAVTGTTDAPPALRTAP